MDPNETLNRLRMIAADYIAACDGENGEGDGQLSLDDLESVADMAELFESLDGSTAVASSPQTGQRTRG